MSASSIESSWPSVAPIWGVISLVGVTLLAALLTATIALVATVGGLVVACGFVDELTGRIPNRLVLVALLMVVSGVAIGNHSSPNVAASAAFGLTIGGAPVLFGLWLLRPDLIGGGDWKLLGVASLALGTIAPLLAALATLLACATQFARVARKRRSTLPFGPSIALGFVGALCLMPWLDRYGGLAS